MALLGNLQHTVRIDEAATGRPVWTSTLHTLRTVAWERQWCDISVCTLELGGDMRPLNQVEPWQHLVSVYANDELVWYGPVYQVRTTRAGARIVAHDPAEYWRRRRVGQSRSYLNRDASQVMRDLVTDGMSVNDPCEVVSFLTAASAGVWVTKEVLAGTRMVMDEVRDLEGMGLAWTISAGRLLVGPVAEHTTAPLSDDHMDGDVAVVKDGAEVVTDMLVQGKGVYGYHVDGEQAVGLLQGIEKADGLVRAQECQSLAQRRVEEAKYPPRRLEFGSSRLLPTAPVGIHELVPGVLVPVSSAQTGTTVSAMMAIKSVKVEQTADGDAVHLTLMERPSALVPELQAPMVEEDYNSPYDRERRDKEQQMARNESTSGGDDLTTSTPPPVV